MKRREFIVGLVGGWMASETRKAIGGPPLATHAKRRRE
jgi:hypothetical protein